MTLSTPIVWVLFPLFFSLLTVIFHQRQLLSMILTAIGGFGLSALAFFFPEDLVISIGPLTISFIENFEILGRQIVISQPILPFIALLYFTTGLWSIASNRSGVPLSFRPISLVISALLTAALGVEPFLYASLFIEAAILFSIPMLSPLAVKTQPGVLRFLSLQTLAMPFILLAGWLLSGVESLPPESPLIVQAIIILGLGLGLWLSVFPFHSWVPMVSQTAHPIPVSFVLFIFPTAILFFSLNFLDRYPFLRTSQEIYDALRNIGALMIVIGGLWTSFQTDIKRAFGFSTLTETGMLLLSVGLASQGGLNWLLMLFPAHALGFWLWAYTLSLIETRVDSSSLESLNGTARLFPFITFGLITAQLSIAGLPLFASFPIKNALLSASFNIGSGLGTWVFIGNLGLFLFSIRSLTHMVMPDENQLSKQWKFSEKPAIYIPIVIIILAIIFTGLFPNVILPNITDTLTAFGQLQ